ncbi:MAG: hypothetical protein WBF03_11020 [Xanthobacteraceae bacterium]
MKKRECETAIRRLCHEWARSAPSNQVNRPRFSDFKGWLQRMGSSQYLDFHSTMGADRDAEMWFDEELKQTWRR